MQNGILIRSLLVLILHTVDGMSMEYYKFS